MRFATLNIQNESQVVALSEDHTRYIPIGQVASQFKGDMVDLISQFQSLQPVLNRASGWQALDNVSWLPPVVPRRNVFCVGKNYHEHAKEFADSGFDSSSSGEVVPSAPVVFTKAPTAIVGHHAAILPFRELTEQLDYEAELAVVIGLGGRGINKANAMQHVFGYTIINDVTARDLQHKHRQWFLGKSMDTFCPMGPALVTADEVDGGNLNISCTVNGQLRQQANTRDLIFDIPTLIATISAGITLYPGDIIATGTPAGVGIGLTPPQFLKSGDEVVIEVQGVGRLVNRVG